MLLDCPQCHSRWDVGPRPAGTRFRCRCQHVFAIPKTSEFAGMLKCPHCGAAASPDRPSCEYCQTPLALVACPACLGRVFEGSSHCAHCGAEVASPGLAPEPKRRRHCPYCPAEARAPLLARRVGDTLLEECPDCGGVWMDRPAFDRVVRDRERQAVVLASVGPITDLAPSRTPPGRNTHFRYLPCPDCSQLMNRRNFGLSSGVILNVCAPHGLWFDRDGLGNAVQFVMSGRFQAAQVRQLEELKRQIARSKEELHDAESAARSVALPELQPHGIFDLLGALLGD